MMHRSQTLAPASVWAGKRGRLQILAALAAALVLFAVGGLLTDRGPWFQALQQPTWKPPGALFGPAWFVILVLAGLATAHAFSRLETPGLRSCLVALAACNLGLNTLWSYLFFQLQRPDWALVDAILLWLSIGGLAALTLRRVPLASLLLLPYLLWVSVAVLLTERIVALNGPF